MLTQAAFFWPTSTSAILRASSWLLVVIRTTSEFIESIEFAEFIEFVEFIVSVEHATWHEAKASHCSLRLNLSF
jgi:hypothetical protein